MRALSVTAMIGATIAVVALASCRPRRDADEGSRRAHALDAGKNTASGSEELEVGSGAGNSGKGTGKDKKGSAILSGGGSVAASAVVEPGTIEDDPVTQKIVKTSGGFDNRLRVKNLRQLRAAIHACVGDGLTAVDASMHLTTAGGVALAPPDGEGRFAFLNPTRFPAGADVLDLEGAFLLDPDRAERFAADADSLSAPFLRALENVANVVAHNCDLRTKSCSCGTLEAAREMARRCLPAFKPDEAAMVAAIEALATTCSAGAAGARKAIASLVASYAFAAKN